MLYIGGFGYKLRISLNTSLTFLTVYDECNHQIKNHFNHVPL